MQPRQFVLIFPLLCSLVCAESTARQSYVVSVPRRLSIAAPNVAPKVEMAQDSSQAELPLQVWTVASNSGGGAVVQFSTLHSFHNLDDDSIRRDAQLEVTVQNQAENSNWLVTKSSATTDHLAGQEQAAVEVRSTGPGSAQIGLKVTLRSAEAFTPTGDYVTTVVGTISAN